MADKTQNTSKGTKRPNKSPSRGRYWASHRLRDRKIANLMRCNGFLTKTDATDHWFGVRKRYAG